MITCQCAEAMPTYASQSSYLTPIPSANIERGVIPLDSLPADWWNWLWNNITLNEGRIVQFINSVFSEINSVLSAAGVTPSTASTTDLRDAIQKLATTVATAAVPGSVLSSTLSGKLRVIADGTASINGLGTPDQLETTSKEVVSAINEVLALAQGKAPTSHASSDTTYGVGTTQQYGHVKVTEGCGLAISCGTISLNAPGYNCTGTVTQICYNGAAYSPSDGVVDLGNSPSGFPGYGTAICPLSGDAGYLSEAGISDLVARADHVHQMPTYMKYGPNRIGLCSTYLYLCASDTCLSMYHKTNFEGSHMHVQMYSLHCSASTTYSLAPTTCGNILCAYIKGSNDCLVHQAYVPFQCISLDALYDRIGGPQHTILGGGFLLDSYPLVCMYKFMSGCADVTRIAGDSLCHQSISTRTSVCMGGVLVW